MRKYAYLKDPVKSDQEYYIYKIMLFQSDEGAYLFTYADPDAVQCSSDQWYESLEDLFDDWNDRIDERGWIDLEDPLPDCQQDAFIPLRVKGRDTGKPEWGHYETLQDGQWIDYRPVEVRFYDEKDDNLFKFAVIIARTNGQWVFCKHKERETYEIPGGHREEGEEILDTARRELQEETGALEYSIKPVCVYSVIAPDNFDGIETFGMIYIADITSFEKELHSEMERIIITDRLPDEWTYPLIQPKMIEEARRRGLF